MKSAADSASGNSPAFGSQEFNDKGYVNAMWVTTCHVTMLDCSAKADRQEATHPEYACHFQVLAVSSTYFFLDVSKQRLKSNVC